MGIKKINDLDDAQEEINALRVVVKREQAAREKAENLLENRASHLFNINQRLHEQYVSASKKNQEIDYLLKITKLEAKDNEIRSLLLNFLEISSMLLWTEYSFAFKLDKESKKIIPITSYIISQNPEDQKDTETQFVKEDFSLLDIFADEKKLTIFSNFKSDIKKINSNYSRLNHSYLFPVEVDSHDKFFIWLTFANIVDLDQRTVDLVDRGISQLKGTLQKHKSKYQLLENYKKLKEVKSQLIQSEKMASLGTISAGIAHEINNPLSFLLTNSEVLKEYLTTIIQYIKRLENPTENETDITKLKKSIDYILQDTPMLMNESLEGIDRIKEIVNGLKTFSRADDGDIKEFDINTCIETSLRLVSNELKHKCKITKNFQSLPPVRGSAGQIIQVLTNLLVNSAQAIEDFGLIEISTKESENNIIVSIKDSGKGISQENLDQLFTPFFTTKPTGQGTGLGLSISYGIIKKHKGDITVESTIGKGTEFCIFLPKEQR